MTWMHLDRWRKTNSFPILTMYMNKNIRKMVLITGTFNVPACNRFRQWLPWNHLWLLCLLIFNFFDNNHFICMRSTRRELICMKSTRRELDAVHWWLKWIFIMLKHETKSDYWKYIKNQVKIANKYSGEN